MKQWILFCLCVAVGCGGSTLVDRSRIPEEYFYKPLGNLPAMEITTEPEHDLAKLTRFLRENPGNITAHRKRGWEHARAGRYKEAITDFNQAIALSGDGRGAPPPDRLARLHACRAIVHQAAGNSQEALHDLDQAIRLEPDHWEYYFHRWQTHRQAGNSKRAGADRQRGLELKPEIFEREYSSQGGLIYRSRRPRGPTAPSQ